MTRNLHTSPDNILDRLSALERKFAALIADEIGVDRLSDLTPDSGDLRAGRFLALSAGNEPTDTDAIGTFISARGETFNSNIYHIGGVNLGTLQWGADSLTGKFMAGAGVVILDEDGLTLLADQYGIVEPANGNTIRWIYNSYNPLYIGATYSTGGDYILADIQAIGNNNERKAELDIGATNFDESKDPFIILTAPATGSETSTIYIGADEIHFAQGNLLIAAGYGIGIGTTINTVMSLLNSASVLADFTSSGASSPTSGGVFALYTDDGAALASGDRAGGYLIGGAYDASHTLTRTAGVTAFATEAWSGTNRGTRIVLEGTPAGSTARVEWLTLSENSVFNENGLDANFRFEGDNDSTLLVLDAGLDTAAFGGVPVAGQKLKVVGDMTVTGALTSGSLALTTDLPLTEGGTGASTAANARTNLGLANNTYTPTLTNVTNIAASTAYSCNYSQVGDVVTVGGRVAVDPTATGACELGISLPIASTFIVAQHCTGAGAAPAVAGFSVAILADTTNNRASMQWVAVDIANRALYFSFVYKVI